MAENRNTSDLDLRSEVLASAARVHDHLLGGHHGFAFDREFAQAHSSAVPLVRRLLRLERDFLNDAVLMMLRRGIRQFLDLGAGLPSWGGVHDVASYLERGTVVVHVDHDLAAVEHGSLLLRDSGSGHYLHADLVDVDGVLVTCAGNGWLDLDRPVGVLAVGVLDLLGAEDDAERTMTRYAAELAADSMFAITHRAPGFAGPHRATAASLLTAGRGSLCHREIAGVRAMFGGTTLVKPGVVALPHVWPGLRPRLVDPAVPRDAVLAGVSVKRR
ncbi:SAM-dependent methyltransferase [Lentzea sp. NBRC 102530]|uniref:SAM-dependent methyltransferase n=1 Tax=Lentzea sp. NBRC 102530 TaxID=3032201 RepID=UPI0024A044D5|nr:SAM-dependent methyltransferase [Lentzea sp. NBRC 102530]GLY46840.1 hypothetical protein Lesp01_04960 [Lentzea sp. NBRC 102530]